MIDGQIVPKALPGGAHSSVESGILRGISTRFHRTKRNDGSGGWWILTEISVLYKNMSEMGRILTADIAGWKRDRVPTRPSEYPVKETPDWVCEVCHTTRKKDTTIVPETLAAEGVEWYWLADVEDELLTIFHLENGKYSVVKTWPKDAGKARLPPFEAVELSLPELFGEDPEEEEL